jgi:ribosomal protein S18 acetylase RimI-like enzyme
MKDTQGIELSDMPGDTRELAVPIIKESFVGIYRWHAKRTLRRITCVRAARFEGTLVGISMLERLVPEAGYVYYMAIGKAFRNRGIGGLLLDDAIAKFRSEGAKILYAAAEEDNEPSLALLRSRGFRLIERKEQGYKEGGLGAWGLRSKMMLVSGEVLMGTRL